MDGVMKKFAWIGLLVAVAQPPLPAEAQLAEVHQTIFGMDCAPCAYAVERRMGNLEGATQVQLSLNEGFAAVRFEGVHGTTLEEIRKAIRDSGFGPREARVRLRGTAQREDGASVLRTPAGERYLLEGGQLPVPSDPEGEVVVEGTVATDPDASGRWVLRVEGG